METEDNLPEEKKVLNSHAGKFRNTPGAQEEETNQQDDEFSELEKSRMENPPEHREENGAKGTDADHTTTTHQQEGI